MLVATHSGNFHADDVFAVATLRLALGELDLIRTRDRDAFGDADIRLDLGGRNDASTGDFDHHQKGGAGERSNGIRYASFGLIWREYGAKLAGGNEAARAIDERIVQGVDANDTGQTIAESTVGGVRAMSVSGLIGAMNPSWDEQLTAQEEDARFAEAVAFATGILQRELAGSAAFQRAQELVGSAISRAADPRVIELDRNMPWREGVLTSAPLALFVVYPKSDGWALQAVPRELGGFGNRKDLPTAWAGLTDAALAEVTGVPDARFAHTAGFYAAAGSREGIMALVEQALAA